MGTTKIKPWKKILLDERKDLKTMEEYQKLYKDNVEGYADDMTYIHVSNTITKLLDDQDKQLEKIDNAQSMLTQTGQDEHAREEAMDRAIARFSELVVEQRIYFIADENKYHVYHNDSVWKEYSERSVYKLYQCYKPFEQEAFNMALLATGQLKTEAVWSFRAHPNRVLNKLSTVDWLKPLANGDTAYPKVIAYMLLAMSGDRVEVIDHIEQVIYWKYKHPEDYKLPCVSLHGVGGLGKNTLVNMVLKPIFGHKQVTTVSFSTIEKYAARILGKAVVYIDENEMNKESASRMKELVGNQSMGMDGKWMAQGEVDSTAMFITGGNDNLGSLLLDGTDADRRWSIIKSNMSYKDIVCKYEGFDIGSKELDKFLADGMKLLEDHDNIAKWVGYLEEKWGGMEYCPRGYHEDDYKVMIRNQEKTDDAVFRIIFGDDKFTWISNTCLYDAYKLYFSERAGGQKYYFTKFLSRADMWLNSHGSHLAIERKKHVVIIEGEKKRVPMFNVVEIFKLADFDNTINADEYYVKKNEYGKNVAGSDWMLEEEILEDANTEMDAKVIKLSKL